MPPRTQTPNVMRMAHPLAFRGFLRQVGAPVDRSFQAAGLPTLCEEADVAVAAPRVLAMFDDMMGRETPDLGWHVGRWVRDQSLNAGLLARVTASPTLHSGLLEFARLARLENSDVQLGFAPQGDRILFWVEGALKELPGRDAGESYSVQIMISVLQDFMGPDWEPTEIGIQPSTVPRIVEHMYPDTRIVPGCSKYYVAIDKALLSRPPHQGPKGTPADEPDLPRALDELDFVETLTHLIRANIRDGYPVIDAVAEMATVSRRTLQRRLAQLDANYSDLVSRVRFDIAATMLAETDASVTAIANITNYSDSSHFARSFRRICGVSPLEYRSQARQLGAE